MSLGRSHLRARPAGDGRRMGAPKRGTALGLQQSAGISGQEGRDDRPHPEAILLGPWLLSGRAGRAGVTGPRESPLRVAGGRVGSLPGT